MSALALLSTLFLFSRGAGDRVEIPYSDAEIAERLRDQQITGPFFSGTTTRGDRIALNAEKITALPAGNRAEGLTAQLDLAGGGRVYLSAGLGTLDLRNAQASLQRDVALATADGLQVQSQSLVADLDTGALRSFGQVEAQGALGTLRAGQMSLERVGTASAQLLFTNGVKLLYKPNISNGAARP